MKIINESKDTVRRALKYLRTFFLLGSVVFALQTRQGIAQSNPDASRTNPQKTIKERDGQRDFDFHIGTWKTHLKRLLKPFTGGSTTWVEFEGITVVRNVWNGRQPPDLFRFSCPHADQSHSNSAVNS